VREGAGPVGATPTLERPKKAQFGDYSTNAAMLLAPKLGAPPREVAERLGEALRTEMGERLARVEVAGPGFLNLFLADGWYRDALGHVLDAQGFGGGGAGADAERVLVEFVSANPTGPLHVGHARNAAYGDALARVLAFHGHAVEREFYVNDAGSQVLKLAESIQARGRGEEPPEDGYAGDYVTALAEQIPEAASLPLPELDQSYRSEGALWLRTTGHGDDKDRVLERSSGEHTYFASDIAYHLHKRERGFDRLIDVWGADHHGYVQRMKAMYEALGGDPEKLELLIMQFVHLVAGGSRAAMSKRAGEFVTLDYLLGEVGVDAARWFLLQRSHDTTIDLDLDLARQESAENPVYYVQYAHARIASILGRADGAAPAVPASSGAELHPAERALILHLLAFPEEVAEAAVRRAPHRIATYALDLAQQFTAFYRDCKVLGAEGDGVEEFRRALCVASQRTIATSLDLLGVDAPEEM